MTLIGRPGAVARVDRWPMIDDGRLVVLDHRAGRVAVLVGSDEPVEAWRCRLMGAPATLHGQTVRQLYVPDWCLTTVGSMNADQIAELGRAQALENFDTALAELGQILSRSEATAEQFADNLDEQLGRAGEQALIQRCLELVATGTALHEVGFRPVAPEQDLLRWLPERNGTRLRLEAIQNPFGLWDLSCTGFARNEAHADEASVFAEGPRGELLLPILRMWRSAYPGEAIPPGLAAAQTFQRHREALRSAARPPALRVDTQVFRAVRGWLADRYGRRADALALTLSHADDLLRVVVDGVPFGCPAYGTWPEPCTVDLAELLVLPIGVFRRRSLTLELTPTHLLVNDCPVPRTA